MAERILIVDDEREIADLIGLYLENENFTVFITLAVKDGNVPCGFGNQPACAVRPLHHKHRATRKIVLPSYCLDVLLAGEPVEVHVYK